jgi:RNA polymerase sigma-70 factor (ECF subfamily)
MDAAAVFDPLRPRLMRLAYGMLGSVTDAEDVLQDAFIRWMCVDRSEVREPDAYLRRVVTCLCLDVLKSASRQRETYVGPWLPEPVVEPEDAEVNDVTLPLMLALERLSPLERAAFLLHDVFGAPFAEVAEAVGRDEAACRQLAARARAHVRADRPRYSISREKGLQIAHAFHTAVREGDMSTLRAMLVDDVVVHADGGGKRAAAYAPIVGIEQVLKSLASLARRLREAGPSELIRYALINGLPGFVTREADGILQTTALEIDNGRIIAVYAMRNPDKLARLENKSVH